MLNREALNCPPPRKRSRLTRHIRAFSGFKFYLGYLDISVVLNLFQNPPTHLPQGKREMHFTFHSSLKKRAAFTLAEVLITLGIIGVVAAITMPSVIGRYKRQETLSRLKKAYTTINQALKMSEADNGEYEYWDTSFSLGANAYLEEYWLPYFNILKICNTYSECNYKNAYPWIRLNGQDYTLTFSSPVHRIPFITTDGILYSISSAGMNSDGSLVESSSIYIDINGSRGPNTIGKDFFVFERVKDKGILPNCYNYKINSIKSNCSKTGSGDCCAQWIIMNGWQFPKDYPY